jgi:hypothetical protein
VPDLETIRPRVLERPVFSVGGETFTWRDVISAALAYGALGEVEEATREGLAAERRLAASGEEVEQSDLVEATTRFRYDWNLLAGDQLTEWLQRWEITPSEWREYVRRTLLRKRWAGELAETVRRFPVEEGELVEPLWAEAVCSGFLVRFAERLAVDVALAAESGVQTDGGGESPERFRAAAAQARDDLLTGAAIDHEVSLHGLEWLRVEGDALDVPNEDTAREAALCIRMDGRTLVDVAEDCGVTPRRLRVYVADVDAELSPRLAAARVGELVGPVARDDGFSLFFIDAKTAPSAEDPETRRRAEERVVARAAQRAVAEYVNWHE